MDKFDLSDASKEYALEKLEFSKKYSEGTINFVSDKDIMRYKNNFLGQWLSQGDIIKLGKNYFIYLGYSKPRENYLSKLKHHLYNNKGKRFIWTLDINLSIKKVL